jgi:hypothetical protein
MSASRLIFYRLISSCPVSSNGWRLWVCSCVPGCIGRFAARTSVKALGTAVVGLTAAVHKEAAALADSSGVAGGLGGFIATAAAGLGLSLDGPGNEQIDSVTAGTPEWMAPELLAATVPPTWFEPDPSGGVCTVDRMVPGLREVVRTQTTPNPSLRSACWSVCWSPPADGNGQCCAADSSFACPIRHAGHCMRCAPSAAPSAADRSLSVVIVIRWPGGLERGGTCKTSAAATSTGWA